MRCVLAITADKEARPWLELPGLQTAYGQLSLSCDILEQELVHAVVINDCIEGELARPLVQRLHAMAARRRTPIFLAISTNLPKNGELLDELFFDGVLDLRWSKSVIARSLVMAIRMTMADSKLIEAQLSFLNEVVDKAEYFKELTCRDDLTQLFNRRFFEKVIKTEHARCLRFSQKYTVVFIDVDNLREINAAHGHLAGSQVLTQVGDVISSMTRRSDYACRFGGDEFVTLLLNATAKGSYVYAERLRTKIQQLEITFGEHSVGVTVSMGVASFPGDGATSHEVLNNADTALYAAKNGGRDRVVLYSALSKKKSHQPAPKKEKQFKEPELICLDGPNESER